MRHTRAKSPGTFDQWFSGIQFGGLVDGVLRLVARDEFVRSWVDEHFVPELAEYIRSATDWSVNVFWSIDGALVCPVADLVPPPSAYPRALRASTEHSAEALSPGDRSPEAAETPSRRRPSVPPPPPAAHPKVAPPVVGLNARCTFANFIVGPSNQLAQAAAFAAAGGGGRRHNPLFLCGGTGLGKTHLVQAIAHRVRDEQPEARIVYLSAEHFVNEFILSVRGGGMPEFRARYRDNCDFLLVDDIQFLAGKEQTQEEFFHAFNALHQAGKPIVVTSDKYPQQLERIEERLISRFHWGLVADIQAPEFETRVAIVQKKAELEGIDIPDPVVLFIAQSVRSNVRELEGALVRLAVKSSLLRRSIDLEFARAELAATTSSRVSETSVEDIQHAVCHHFKVRSNELVGKARHRSIAFARHVAMYLCKVRLNSSFPELGRAFGNRDHTTVMSAVRKVEVLRDADPQVRAHIEALERKLGTNE